MIQFFKKKKRDIGFQDFKIQDSRFNFFLLKTEHTKYLQSITIKTTIKTTSTIGINLTNLVELSFERGLHM